ncbi:MAG: 5-formyltetrahydrofolate cyclo-ligase [Candidatus Methylomirabilia bacterium]
MESALHRHLAKSDVRRALTEARARLTESGRRERSRRIAGFCRGLAGFSSAEIVCSYVDFRDEVETSEFIAELLQEGRRVAVPVQLPGRSQPLVFVEINSLAEMARSHFGILQPPLVAERLVPTAAIPLFLVPGLAFDPAGRRLGYGLGCYDRAFADAAPGALKVGLAFELQILESVPADSHDVPMDFVVTEDRVIPAAAGAGSPTRRC